jgi:hypothetical protein
MRSPVAGLHNPCHAQASKANALFLRRRSHDDSDKYRDAAVAAPIRRPNKVRCYRQRTTLGLAKMALET